MVHRRLQQWMGYACVIAVSSAAYAQQPAGIVVKRDTTASPALFTMRDAVIATGFALGTVVFFPLDRAVERNLRNPSNQTNQFLKNASTGVELIASPGAYFIGGALYAVGEIGHYERVADLGWHGTEAVLVSDVFTDLLKGTLGRARPFVSKDTNPADFRFAGGFGNNSRTSFPSGHTSTAFAAAAAVTAETARWWPQSTKVIGPLMYGGATMVGLSRMYHDKHWASDVALGAAIGTLAGRKVVQYAHAHPNNFVDRIMLRTALVPSGDGRMTLVMFAPLP